MNYSMKYKNNQLIPLL
ncbi:MAG: hypothetical protein E7598_03985 [Ruminococcaceae bacterium]|nr:hypothetical protein [Oscillospiraceae bacterium]